MSERKEKKGKYLSLQPGSIEMQFDIWMVWALLSNNGCNATHQGWGRKKTLPGMRLAPNHFGVTFSRSYGRKCKTAYLGEKRTVSTIQDVSPCRFLCFWGSICATSSRATVCPKVFFHLPWTLCFGYQSKCSWSPVFRTPHDVETAVWTTFFLVGP